MLDPDRKKFENLENCRFDFLRKMVDTFKLTGNTSGERVICLTAQISTALGFSITVVQYPIKLLLEKGMGYCLTAQF